MLLQNWEVSLKTVTSPTGNRDNNVESSGPRKGFHFGLHGKTLKDPMFVDWILDCA